MSGNLDKIKKHEVQIWELETEIIHHRVEIFCLKSQLSTAKSIRKSAYGYDYGASLERLRRFLFLSSQIDLIFLNFDTLKPYSISQ